MPALAQTMSSRPSVAFRRRCWGPDVESADPVARVLHAQEYQFALPLLGLPGDNANRHMLITSATSVSLRSQFWRRIDGDTKAMAAVLLVP
jgi:hypothetical protein